MVRSLYRLSVQSMNKSKLLSLIVLLGKDTKSSNFTIQHFIKYTSQNIVHEKPLILYTPYQTSPFPHLK